MPNWDATAEDFTIIEQWGLAANPLAAIEDFSEKKLALRSSNQEHLEAHLAYIAAREDYIQKKDFDHYYKVAEKPIDKNRWEYLKRRKAWFICPVEWGRFARPDCSKILDLGCGDGDVTQRVADYICQCWQQDGYDGHEIEIVGVDLNPSRVENAKKLCQSPHPKISLHFEVGNAVENNLRFQDKSFDYVLNTGVLEILADQPALAMIKEICRLASKGVYIEDLADEYPGGFPRNNLPELLAQHDFKTIKHHWIFTEPFNEHKLSGPKKLWPILKDQVLFAVC